MKRSLGLFVEFALAAAAISLAAYALVNAYAALNTPPAALQPVSTSAIELAPARAPASAPGVPTVEPVSHAVIGD